jgi:16S rRNA (cytosine1402-N4)-methyltransferase
VQNNFKYLKKILVEFCIDKVDGIIMDLGVSSFQLDNPERGFSYKNNTGLDMRMDTRTEKTAYDIVNSYTEEDICYIIKKYGEERWAKRIAQFIVKNRQIKDIRTTFELVEIIKAAIPAKARKDGGHPAKRTFQALRIEVNNELDVLKQTMSDIIDSLIIGGRACIITFHSLEDRIVKEEIKEKLGLCSCPSNFPACVCKRDKIVKKITKKPVTAGENELFTNSRAKSAKLRVIEKTKL